MRSRERFSEMFCSQTGKDEWQSIVSESEDGITLRCNGCGKEHSHEIGEFADRFQLLKCRELVNKRFMGEKAKP